VPKSVRVVEVGPRDGLQNEPKQVDTAVKLELIRQLAQGGLRTIEATAFVSPKWVPQMADHKEVLRGIQALDLEEPQSSSSSSISFPVLVPNMKGLELAMESGAKEVSVFASASQSFSKRNINCTIEESLERFQPVVQTAKRNGIRVRGYVSCVIACPYEGEIDAESSAKLSEQLLEMGCYEISLGDTIGVGSPGKSDCGNFISIRLMFHLI
jgi:isopropylmalate/homocitrate/citramalate synthase